MKLLIAAVGFAINCVDASGGASGAFGGNAQDNRIGNLMFGTIFGVLIVGLGIAGCCAYGWHKPICKKLFEVPSRPDAEIYNELEINSA